MGVAIHKGLTHVMRVASHKGLTYIMTVGQGFMPWTGRRRI